MKLYDHPTAPNPRRVHVFMAEKGIEIERINVDMQKGEHKTEAFMQKNANGQIPVLELDDGAHISESISICRYLEALQPSPTMFGDTPEDIGRIDMHLRRIELLLGRNVSTSWVNGPIVAKLGRFEQIPSAKQQSDAFVNNFYARLDRELSERAMIAGDEYCIADITAMVTIDFAEQLVGLKPDPALTHLARWREAVGRRPSASAS
ncbi:MAG: glutathione S-transferase family protein [Gammaproteobacteria bacterium]|nr:glutathione S-transferase family protein [Gammaproteobacteria bacterium]